MALTPFLDLKIGPLLKFESFGSSSFDEARMIWKDAVEARDSRHHQLFEQMLDAAFGGEVSELRSAVGSKLTGATKHMWTTRLRRALSERFACAHLDWSDDVPGWLFSFVHDDKTKHIRGTIRVDGSGHVVTSGF